MGVFFKQSNNTSKNKSKYQRLIAEMMNSGSNQPKTYRSPWEGVGELAQAWVGARASKKAIKYEQEEKEAKNRALMEAMSGDSRESVVSALLANPDTADMGAKMKMQGFEKQTERGYAREDMQFNRESQMEMLGKELEMRGKHAQANVIAPSSVREHQYFQGLNPQEREEFLNTKRANRMYDMGGGYQQFSQDGNNAQSYYQKTVKTEDTAGFKANVETSRTAAIESEKARQEWIAGSTDELVNIDKLRQGLASMDQRVDDAKGMVNSMTTGLVGGLLSNLGESDAGILKARLNEIKALATNEIMQSMKGLGSISDADRAGFEKALGGLDNAQNGEEIRRALDNIATKGGLAVENARKKYAADKERYSKPASLVQQPQGGTDTSGGIPPRYGKTKMKQTQYDPLLKELAANAGVPYDLARAVSYAESAGNPKARSHKGAYGLMQVMPATLKDAGYGIAPAKDNSMRETSRVGMEYLAAMMKKYDGNVDKALAAYNAGSGNVDKYGGVPPFKETRQYIGRIKGYMTEKGQDGIPKAYRAASQERGVSASPPQVQAPNSVSNERELQQKSQQDRRTQLALSDVAYKNKLDSERLAKERAVSRPQKMVSEATPQAQPQAVEATPVPAKPSLDLNAKMSEMAKTDANINMKNVEMTARKYGISVEEVLARMGGK